MRSVQTGPFVGLMAQFALLPVLAVTVGLGGPGWGVGLAYALITNGVLTRGLARRGSGGFGPADWVTLVRATLVGGIAAMTADSFNRSTPVIVLVSFAAAALLLDAVDGRVARRTDTASEFGACFDMEVDAFLILVLSVYAAPSFGVWVLMIGLARYLFVVAGWFRPWLRGLAPPRYWSRVVAAIQGVVLTTAAADILPRLVINVALAASLGLLAESFGRDVWWLWRHRQAGRHRRVFPAVTLTVLAVLAVWGALTVPTRISLITPEAFMRIPLEGLVIVAVALVVSPAGRRPAAAVFGVLLGLLIIMKALDLGFFAVFNRRFDVVNDWSYFGPAVGVLGNSIGRAGAIATVAAAVAFVVATVIAMSLAVARLTRAAVAHRRVSIRAVTALGVVWILCAVTGLQSGPGVRVASASATSLAYAQLHQVHHDFADRKAFAAEIADDSLRDTADDRLLAALRGKDVILAFVESYGRVAVQGSSIAPGVDAVLDAGTRRLHAGGFSARSAFLTSPTFGGASWLAHSTLQSGLWVDSQQRYDQLLTRDRLTLTSAFARAGWRTVIDVPANTTDWPQGSRFYHVDTLYDSRNVGYHGPKFGYATMPDQYVLSAFHRLELTKTNRAPVMAEIDLVSSHYPWTPLPNLLAWNRVGDGTIFSGMPTQGESGESAVTSPDKVRALYGQSIEYTMNTLFSFVTTYPDPNLILIVVGDHQPNSSVTGDRPSRDVPISIITRDPSVLRRISGWKWQDGMLPNQAAPVWPMSDFRSRFLAAYGR